MAGVNGKFTADMIETPVPEFKMFMGGDLLQLAVPIFYTSGAIQRMVAQKQVERCLAHPSYLRAVKDNRHAITDLFRTGRDGASGPARDFHKTEAA